MIKGVDVASYQPDTFSTSGLDFVFTKATEGTGYVNPKMAKQAATARTAGLGLGFYHFLHPGQIKEQAAYFVAKAVSLPGDLLVCDWETTGAGTHATCTEKDLFLREVKRLRPDHRVGLYCNRDYWLHKDVTSYCADFLWIADPDAPAGAPRIKHPWTFHQYGISGGFDRDVANFKDRAALRTWAGYPAPAPKPEPKPAVTLDQRVADLEKRVTTLESKVK